MIRAFLFALVLCLPSGLGSDPALDARERLLAAADLVTAANSAGDRVAALTDAVRAYDSALAAMRGQVRRLTLEAREVEQALIEEDGDISTLLALMQNASAQTETQSLLHPGGAVETIRAGSLASALIPNLYERAAVLEGQLTELTELQSLIASGQATLADGLEHVQMARSALGDALTERQDLPPRLATNDAAMQALVNSVDTLSAFADILVSSDPTTSFAGERAWRAPISGTVLEPFSPNAGRLGWRVSTHPKALLISPGDVTIRYSGKFQGEGKVVIAEADASRLLVFAGLSESFVAQGQVLAAGEPIGLAGDGQSAAQDNLNVGGARTSLFSNETLYIEVRQGGVPVDPGTLLTLEQEQG